jgi:hypothetical protein
MRGREVRDRFLSVQHGNLTLRIPLSAFDAQTGNLKRELLPDLKDQWRARFPWLSANAVDVIVEEAEDAYLKQRQIRIDAARPGGTSPANAADARHDLIKALLKDPEDSRAWYALGELLMKQGQADDGFKAMNIGRSIANRGAPRTTR